MTHGTPENFVDDARRYPLDSRIATGGMGEVWRGTDTLLGREVAIKLLKAEYADDPTFRSRFETEARHAASLHHPNVASVFDFGEAAPTDGSGVRRPYLVMELVDGQPLSALLRPAAARPRRHPRPARAGGRRARRRPRRRHRAPRRQARQPAGHARPHGQDHRLRHRPRRRGHGADRDRPGDGHPAVPLPRAGAGRHRHARLRRLLAGRRGVRVPRRAPAVRRRDRGRDRAHAPARARARPARRRPADLAAVVRRAMAKKPEERFADGQAFAAALRNPSSVAGVPAPVSDVDQHPGPAARPGPAGPPTTATDPVDGRTGGTPQRWWLWLLLALAVVAAIVAIVALRQLRRRRPGRPHGADVRAHRVPPSESQSVRGPGDHPGERGRLHRRDRWARSSRSCRASGSTFSATSSTTPAARTRTPSTA